MFKETLGVLGSTLVGAVKQTASEYKPTAKNMGGAFARIAEQGIANLSYRSPILADVAATMLHTFQHELVRRDKVKQFAASDAATSFREDIKKDLGKNATDEAANKEMFKVIEKLNKIVEEQGDSAKNDEFFKKNQELFKEFQKSIKTEQQHPQPQGGEGDNAGPMLERIEANTHKTVDLLAGMEEGLQHPGGPSEGQIPQPHKSSTSGSFVDPYTGLPSIRAAVGGIGGSFLAKVFDDETISKYADKAKKKLFGSTEDKKEETGETSTPDEVRKDKITPKKKSDAKESQVSEILGDLSLDLEKPNKEVTARKNDAKESQVSEILGDLSLDLEKPNKEVTARKNDTVTDILKGKSKEIVSGKESTPDEVRKNYIKSTLDLHEINYIVSRLEKINRIPQKQTEPPLTPHTQDLLKNISSDMGSIPIEKLGGTSSIENTREQSVTAEKSSATTHKLLEDIVNELKVINEKTQAKSEEGGISSVLKSVAGGLGGRVLSGLGSVARAAAPAILPALGVAGAGAAGYATGTLLNEHVINPAIEKMTGRKDETLGGAIWEMFNDDPIKQMEANDVKKVSPKLKEQATPIAKMSAEKAEAEKNAASPANQAPVVAPINNTTNNNNSTTIVAPSSPRNSETTFDRVQQSNFWGRTT